MRQPSPDANKYLPTPPRLSLVVAGNIPVYHTGRQAGRQGPASACARWPGSHARGLQQLGECAHLDSLLLGQPQSCVSHPVDVPPIVAAVMVGNEALHPLLCFPDCGVLGHHVYVMDNRCQIILDCSRRRNWTAGPESGPGRIHCICINFGSVSIRLPRGAACKLASHTICLPTFHGRGPRQVLLSYCAAKTSCARGDDSGQVHKHRPILLAQGQ